MEQRFCLLLLYSNCKKAFSGPIEGRVGFLERRGEERSEKVGVLLRKQLNLSQTKCFNWSLSGSFQQFFFPRYHFRSDLIGCKNREVGKREINVSTTPLQCIAKCRVLIQNGNRVCLKAAGQYL